MIGNTFQFTWEVNLIQWCQTYIPTSLIKAMEIVSYVGDTVCLVGIMGIAYLCIDKKFGKRLLINTIIGFMLAAQIKNVFKRRRPYFDNEGIECLKVVDKNYDVYDIRKQGFSFPSMHSSNTATVTGSIYEYYKKKAYLIIAILSSFIVGISRFILGCHYPTDVLTGWLLGIIFVVVFSKLQDKLSDRNMYIFLLAIGIIGSLYCESSDFYSGFGITLGFICADIIDNKYTHFENTKNVLAMILRLLIAVGAFMIFAEGAKLLIAIDIQEANTFFAYMFRTLRYFVGTFMALGITPMLYKKKILK